MSNAQDWIVENVPDQTDRVIIITGANSGIGYEATRALARKGAHVIIASRNEGKCDQAAVGIQAEIPGAVLEILPLDLADLRSVRAFAGEFKAKYERLDILINNAGIMATPYGQTADGFERQFGTNHLGHFALTGLLLDRLLSTGGSRVVTISSDVHRMGKIAFTNLNGEEKYQKWLAYGQSKLANILFAYELQRRLTAVSSSTISVAAHPGYAATNLQAGSSLFRNMNRFFAQSQEMGTLPSLYAATAPEVNGCDFIGPDGFMGQRGYPIKVKSSGASYNEETAKRLWEASEELTGVRFDSLDNEN